MRYFNTALHSLKILPLILSIGPLSGLSNDTLCFLAAQGNVNLLKWNQHYLSLQSGHSKNIQDV